MTYNEFVPERFIRDDAPILLARITEIRKERGIKNRYSFLRQIATTKLNCKSVEPEGWVWK